MAFDGEGYGLRILVAGGLGVGGNRGARMNSTASGWRPIPGRAGEPEGISGGGLAGGARLTPGEAFSLKLSDGRVIAASQMKIECGSGEGEGCADPTASRAAERVAGQRGCARI